MGRFYFRLIVLGVLVYFGDGVEVSGGGELKFLYSVWIFSFWRGFGFFGEACLV